jgi:hypothetical protein
MDSLDEGLLLELTGGVKGTEALLITFGTTTEGETAGEDTTEEFDEEVVTLEVPIGGTLALEVAT